MGLAVCCPRCGGQIRAPNLARTDWECERCGLVAPLNLPARVGAEIVEAVAGHARSFGDGRSMPMWCPWPLPPGWTVTGVGWAGDERTGARATAVALSGPAPVEHGPADAVFVAEDPGVGLGAGLGGLASSDPGPALREGMDTAPHAKVRIGGRTAPLWVVEGEVDRSTYVGEARGLWLYSVIWPRDGGYLLAEEIVLWDLVESVPAELVYGAPSSRLRPDHSNG